MDQTFSSEGIQAIQRRKEMEREQVLSFNQSNFNVEIENSAGLLH